jgi:transcriptional regulator with XRE-family HTH domain
MHRQTISKILKDNREYLGQMPEESTLQGIAKGLGIDAEKVRLAAARSLVGYTEDRQQTSFGIDVTPAVGMALTGSQQAAQQERLTNLRRLGEGLAPLIDNNVPPESTIEEHAQFIDLAAQIRRTRGVLEPMLHLPEVELRYATLMLDYAVCALELLALVAFRNRTEAGLALLSEAPESASGSPHEPEAGLRTHRDRLESDVNDADDGAGQGA